VGGRHALTLAELVVVLTILATVSAMVVPMAGSLVADSRDVLTRHSLARLREVIAQTYWQDSGRQLPRPGEVGLAAERVDYPQVRYLFVNPSTNPESTTVTFDPAYRLGWRGPYLVHNNDSLYATHIANGFTNVYGENGDPTVLDGWGNPIVIQNPGTLADGRQDVRLVSAGPDGVLDTPRATLTEALTAAVIGDDVVLSFQVR
jgi:type II secretory pathway pseudopilin PulG